jgi:hypothetical protein
MEAKARRLAGEKDQKTDSSNWTPAKPLNTEYKTGLQPLGERMARKSGGRVEGEKAVVDAYVNRDVKAANAKAEGKPHEGGYKKGGRTKKAAGGSSGKGMISFNTPGRDGVKGGRTPQENEQPLSAVSQPRKFAADAANRWMGGDGIDRPHEAGETTPKKANGGKIAEKMKAAAKDAKRPGRATGGKVKGKTNISINILAGQKPPMAGADAVTMPVAPPPPMTPPPAAPIPPAAPPAPCS